MEGMFQGSNDWLFQAVRQGSVIRASNLIVTGTSVNCSTEQGTTPLMECVYIPREDIRAQMTRLLVDNHADVNAQDNMGRTALMLAAYEPDRADVVRRLIRVRACSCTLRDKQGDTVLNYAVYGNNPDIIRILTSSTHTKPFLHLENINNDGHTPLMIAFKRNYKECCKALINHGYCTTSQIEMKQNFRLFLDESEEDRQPFHYDPLDDDTTTKPQFPWIGNDQKNINDTPLRSADRNPLNDTPRRSSDGNFLNDTPPGSADGTALVSACSSRTATSHKSVALPRRRPAQKRHIRSATLPNLPMQQIRYQANHTEKLRNNSVTSLSSVTCKPGVLSPISITVNMDQKQRDKLNSLPPLPDICSHLTNDKTSLLE